jgi:hypothetical protein
VREEKRAVAAVHTLRGGPIAHHSLDASNVVVLAVVASSICSRASIVGVASGPLGSTIAKVASVSSGARRSRDRLGLSGSSHFCLRLRLGRVGTGSSGTNDSGRLRVVGDGGRSGIATGVGNDGRRSGNSAGAGGSLSSLGRGIIRLRRA